MGWRLSTFFVLQRLIGSRADLRYREFLDMERWDVVRLAAWRDRRLRGLLDHAASAIPFYRVRVLAAGSPLEAFPIVTKELLHENYRDLMTSALRAEYETGRCPRRYGWLEITSGGTTGVPTTVIHDADFRDMDRAARLYEQHLSGFPFGTPHYRLWGSMHDIQRTRASRQQRIMAGLSRETLLNAFQMEDARIATYIDLFRREPRDHMIAYVDALEQIALYAENRDIHLPAFHSIMTTGGTLTEDTERLLMRAFSARIHNKYGSRDCGELACACEHGNLHVLSPNVHIEVLNDQDQPVKPGETGRVVVTFLGNRAFPIIRFDIGDVAIQGGPSCACGRPFPTMARVTARTADQIRSTSGGFITPVYIRHTVGVMHGQRKIRRYQFIQHDRTRYELLIQLEAGLSASVRASMLPPLHRDLLEVLGRDATIDIHVVDAIPETTAGKFRHVVNRYQP